LLLAGAAVAATPEECAVRYLAREVPRWSRENHCYSCHNNGDGARALYVARHLHYSVSDDALRDTTAWLTHPSEWEQQGDSPSSDKKLARLQFAVALAEADADREVLMRAADSLAAYQEQDGSWRVEGGAELGSPVTWGPVLATFMMQRVLEKADAPRYQQAIARAGEWLRKVQPMTVPDAAVILWASGRPDGLELIRRAQSSDGGWGPRAHAPAEAFDTALVLLALAGRGPAALIGEGRAFLIRTQLSSGGWPETTRPAGAHSYAQHISTSAWATLALLATHVER